MLKYKDKNAVAAYLFLLPAIILLIIFMLWPMINSAYYSLFKWNLIGQKKFIGLDNYKFMLLNDMSFSRALINTAIYVILNLAIMVVFSMTCALLFEKQTKLNIVGRCLIFIPFVVPVTVMGMVWKMIYEPQYGVINQVLGLFGITGPQWLYDSKIALLAVIIFNVWKEFGMYAIILIGGLQKIPRDLYESAAVEGAGRFQTIRYITIPMLKPIFFFVTTIIIINSFKAFDHIWVMTGGGPGNSTATLVTYIYSKVFDNVGLASAASVILFILVFIVSLFKTRAKKEDNLYD